MVKKEKTIVVHSRKKTADARVTIGPGKGSFKINGTPINLVMPKIAHDVINEPFQLAREVLGDDFLSSIDVSANLRGGGVMGQALAARTGIGKALLEYTNNEALKKLFAEYDRSLFVSDVRAKESKKFLRNGARAKPIKAYR